MTVDCECVDCIEYREACHGKDHYVNGEQFDHGTVMPREIDRAGAGNFPMLCVYHADMRRATEGNYIGKQVRGSEPPDPEYTERRYNKRMVVMMGNGSEAIVHEHNWERRGGLRG